MLHCKNEKINVKLLVSYLSKYILMMLQSVLSRKKYEILFCGGAWFWKLNARNMTTTKNIIFIPLFMLLLAPFFVSIK